MGKTSEKVKIQNYIDVYNASIGQISESNIRTVEVNAIVDRV